MTEGRGQMTEDRRQMTESEGRGQRAEIVETGFGNAKVRTKMIDRK